MKQVLMVAYYFPPMGGSGVQRPLKFAKYLPHFGWQPTVLAPESGSYRTFDASLENELDNSRIQVKRVGAGTPFHKYRSFTGRLASQNEGLQRFIRWLATFVYFPDNKKGWIRPAVEKGLEYIKNNRVDLLYATGPPFSNFVIAQKLKEHTGIPLVLDYRDDMVDGHLVVAATPWHRKKLQRLEHNILKQVEAVTAINDTMLLGIQHRSPDIDTAIYETIEQGYDPADFGTRANGKPWPSDRIHFLYSGIFYDKNQPDIFLKAMAEALEEKPAMKEQVALHFQGLLTGRHRKYIQDLGLDGQVEYHGYLSHDEAVSNLLKADVLWLIANFSRQTGQITTGKLFEYLGASKPVIALVDTQGEAARILGRTKAGYVADPGDRDAIKQMLLSIFDNWAAGSLPMPDKEEVKQYDRKNLTGKLAHLFERVVD